MVPLAAVVFQVGVLDELLPEEELPDDVLSDELPPVLPEEVLPDELLLVDPLPVLPEEVLPELLPVLPEELDLVKRLLLI